NAGGGAPEQSMTQDCEASCTARICRTALEYPLSSQPSVGREQQRQLQDHIQTEVNILRCCTDLIIRATQLPDSLRSGPDQPVAAAFAGSLLTGRHPGTTT